MKIDYFRGNKKPINADRQNWRIYLMDFVDDFRRNKKIAAISAPFSFSHDRMDAMLASTAEYLCDELDLEPSEWLLNVPACADPWLCRRWKTSKQ